MRKHILSMLILLIAIVPCVAEQTIVYVDIQRVMMECNEGKDIQKEIKKEEGRWQGQLDEIESRLEDMISEFEAQKMMMDEKQKSAKEREINELKREGRALLEKIQSEAYTKQDELFDPIVTRMDLIIKRIAKENGYAFVFNYTSPSTLLYADAAYDITDRIILEMNSEYTKSKSGK